MEPKKTNDYGYGPWIFKKNVINDFIRVTDFNRKQAVILGRILYVIDLVGTDNRFCGTMIIEPCYLKGEWKVPYRPWMNGYPGHFKSVFRENMDYNEWVSNNDKMISKFISENTLYIKTTDPILKFYHTQN